MMGALVLGQYLSRYACKPTGRFSFGVLECEHCSCTTAGIQEEPQHVCGQDCKPGGGSREESRSKI